MAGRSSFVLPRAEQLRLRAPIARDRVVELGTGRHAAVSRGDQPRELVVHVGRGGGGSVLASARLARAVVALCAGQSALAAVWLYSDFFL